MTTPYWSDFVPNSTFYRILSGFHRTFATGVACRQGTLTPPDTWSRPFGTCICSTCWDQSFSELVVIFLRTMLFEYPSVLSRFFLINNNTPHPPTQPYMPMTITVVGSMKNQLISIEHLQRVWHADRGRLLLRTPGSVPLRLEYVLLVETNAIPNLSLFYRTMLFEYPSVLSRFCLIKTHPPTHPTLYANDNHCSRQYEKSVDFHRASATGVACRQGTLTPPDTWFCPFETCICSTCWDQCYSELVVILPDYALRISLGTFSILPS